MAPAARTRQPDAPAGSLAPSAPTASITHNCTSTPSCSASPVRWPTAATSGPLRVTGGAGGAGFRPVPAAHPQPQLVPPAGCREHQARLVCSDAKSPVVEGWGLGRRQRATEALVSSRRSARHALVHTVFHTFLHSVVNTLVHTVAVVGIRAAPPLAAPARHAPAVPLHTWLHSATAAPLHTWLHTLRLLHVRLSPQAHQRLQAGLVRGAGCGAPSRARAWLARRRRRPLLLHPLPRPWRQQPGSVRPGRVRPGSVRPGSVHGRVHSRAIGGGGGESGVSTDSSEKAGAGASAAWVASAAGVAAAAVSAAAAAGGGIGGEMCISACGSPLAQQAAVAGGRSLLPGAPAATCPSAGIDTGCSGAAPAAASAGATPASTAPAAVSACGTLTASTTCVPEGLTVVSTALSAPPAAPASGSICSTTSDAPASAAGALATSACSDIGRLAGRLFADACSATSVAAMAGVCAGAGDAAARSASTAVSETVRDPAGLSSLPSRATVAETRSLPALRTARRFTYPLATSLGFLRGPGALSVKVRSASSSSPPAKASRRASCALLPAPAGSSRTKPKPTAGAAACRLVVHCAGSANPGKSTSTHTSEPASATAHASSRLSPTARRNVSSSMALLPVANQRSDPSHECRQLTLNI
eukprot:scaffold13859_cov84-Isochrysis_galbana.AAC.2